MPKARARFYCRMIAEIGGWATLFYLTSCYLPALVPRFRSHEARIAAIPIVFNNHNIPMDSERQRERESLDRVVGLSIGLVTQLLITGLGILDLVTPVATLPALVIGFYLYDMIYLGVKLQNQTMYLAHHAATICLVGYLSVIDSPYRGFADIMYILLEFSSASINFVNLVKYFDSQSSLIPTLSACNLAVYGLTRIVVYPVNLVVCAAHVASSDRILIHVPPLAVLGLLYVLCVYWFGLMVQKHIRMRGAVE